MTGTHSFSFAVKPKVSGVEFATRHNSTQEGDYELLRLLDLQLGLVVAFVTGLASFKTTTISALSPYKYMSLVHTAGTQTASLHHLSAGNRT